MIALLNPTSARWKFRFPLSLMHVGAYLEDKYPYEILDQNLDKQVGSYLHTQVLRGNLKYLGITVMPGPQLLHAIPLTRSLKSRFPDLTIIWGGYFPSLHAETILRSGSIDYLVSGQGERTFLDLIDVLEGNSKVALEEIRGLSFRRNGTVIKNHPREPSDPNLSPPLPYHKVDGNRYVGKSCLGTRTAAYYSSVGCPFLCGFCAVASVYRARWLPKSADLVVSELKDLQHRYGANAIEFFDENFFTSESRASEFSSRMVAGGITWWAEGRPDRVLQYSDETLENMKRSGCKMIFFGAESASEEVLHQMNKGGTQTPDTVLMLAERLKKFEIVPEFSFVFGHPGDDVDRDFDNNMKFIRHLKKINPQAEIVLYMYAPVMFEESSLFQIAKTYGFSFPQSLDAWMQPEWQDFDLRKSPVIPWLKARHYRRFKNFERVMHGRFPTITDLRLTRRQRDLLQLVSSWRYRLSLYAHPLEVRLLQHLFQYRKPEIEGL